MEITGGLLLSYRSLCWIFDDFLKIHDDIFLQYCRVDHLSPKTLYPAVTLGPKPLRSQAVQGHLELLNNGEPPSFWKASGGKSFKTNDSIERNKFHIFKNYNLETRNGALEDVRLLLSGIEVCRSKKSALGTPPFEPHLILTPCHFRLCAVLIGHMTALELFPGLGGW